MTVTLQWDPSPQADLSHYEVHFGRASGIYDVIDQRSNAVASIQNLQDGCTWYFAVKSVDLTGNKSAFSNEISRINKFVRIQH